MNRQCIKKKDPLTWLFFVVVVVVDVSSSVTVVGSTLFFFCLFVCLISMLHRHMGVFSQYLLQPVFF